MLTRKGWERYKLDRYDRFLMERDMLNPRPWMGRRHIARACVATVAGPVTLIWRFLSL